MAVDAQELFQRAIGLMDEGDEFTGRTDIPETLPYKHRVLSLLNILGQECAAALGTPEIWTELDAFDRPLALREEMARMVLPYGLAAHLLLEENPAAANFFQQRYEALLARWLRGVGAEFEDIPLPHGDLEANADRGWPKCP